MVRTPSAPAAAVSATRASARASRSSSTCATPLKKELTPPASISMEQRRPCPRPHSPAQESISTAATSSVCTWTTTAQHSPSASPTRVPQRSTRFRSPRTSPARSAATRDTSASPQAPAPQTRTRTPSSRWTHPQARRRLRASSTGPLSPRLRRALSTRQPWTSATSRWAA